MKNPIDGHEVGAKTAAYIEQLREVRNNARRKMRSGNPAVRAAAARAYLSAPILIQETYRQDHGNRH